MENHKIKVSKKNLTFKIVIFENAFQLCIFENYPYSNVR